MIDLDDPAALAAADPGGMLAAIESAAAQWVEGELRARRARLPEAAPGPSNIVVCGMGGSGIAGDVLTVVPTIPVPVVVAKGYSLPAFVGRGSLVVCLSYSGNTEETLACFDEAVARGAQPLVVATGGALAERAAATGAPCIAPVERLQPRAAFPSLTAISVVAAERFCRSSETACAGVEDALAAGVAAWGRDVPAERNDAKSLALRLNGFVPLIWGQAGPLAVAAYRWQCQMNENAKQPAHSAMFSELDHNYVMAFDPGLGALEQHAIVVLRGEGEDPRVARRIEPTLAVAGRRVGAVVEGRVPGAGLGQLMSAVLLGDFVTTYLALVRGVDPTPIGAIEDVKRRLA